MKTLITLITFTLSSLTVFSQIKVSMQNDSIYIGKIQLSDGNQFILKTKDNLLLLNNRDVKTSIPISINAIKLNSGLYLERSARKLSSGIAISSIAILANVIIQNSNLNLSNSTRNIINYASIGGVVIGLGLNIGGFTDMKKAGIILNAKGL